MGKKSDLSPRKIGQIKVLLANSKLNQRQIARKLSIAQSSVSEVKRRLEFQGTGSPRRVGRCGRKRKTTPTTDRWLARESLKNRRQSSRILKQKLEEKGIAVNTSTVRRRLCEAGIKAHRPQKKPHLNARMKRQRLAWAKQFKTWTAEDWSRVS